MPSALGGHALNRHGDAEPTPWHSVAGGNLGRACFLSERERCRKTAGFLTLGRRDSDCSCAELVPRQVEREVGAAAGFGVDGDGAAVLVDDSAGGGQAQAGAFALGREVGVEQFFADGRVDAWAGVDDVDLDAIAVGLGADDQVGRAAVGLAGVAGFDHRLRGIEQQVEQGLLEEGDIEGQLAGGRVELGAKADARGFGLGVEEVGELLDDAVDVGGLGVEPDAAGEGEEIFEDSAEAVGLGGDGVEAVLQAGQEVWGQVGVVDGFSQELEIQADGGQGVLDFMGQAAGEGAQLGESLGGLGALFESADASGGATCGEEDEGYGQGDTAGNPSQERDMRHQSPAPS